MRGANFWRKREANDRVRGVFGQRERYEHGVIFGVKERNEPRNFEGARRVKEQKKPKPTEKQRRGRTIGCGPHSRHHRLHRSSQSPPTAPSSSKNRRRDGEVRGRKIQRNRDCGLCTEKKKKRSSSLAHHRCSFLSTATATPLVSNCQQRHRQPLTIFLPLLQHP
jgi:hypothetical protein